MTIAEKDAIILPHSVDINAILSDLGRIKGERALLILSYVYTVGQWRFDYKYAKIEIHTDTLLLLGGSNNVPKKAEHIEGIEKEDGKQIINSESYNNSPKKAEHIEGIEEMEKEQQYLHLINYLVSKKILKRYSSYEVGKSSKEICYVEKDICFQKQQLYTLTSKNSKRAFNKKLNESRAAFYTTSPTHHKLFTSVNQLVYDSGNAWEYITNHTDDRQRAMLHWYHYHIKNGFELWKVDEQGRVYTMPVVIPRELRKYLSWNGEPLYQLDVSHCQPLLHGLLYDLYDPTGKHSDEKHKYLALCGSGEFYQFLNNKCKTEYVLEDENQKRLFKEKIFAEVFYGHPNSKSVLASELCRVMHGSFPLLAKILSEVKHKDHTRLPKTMQAIEADIIIDGVVSDCKDGLYPIISIHDAILTTEDGLAPVRRSILNNFNQLRLNPKVKLAEITKGGSIL